MPSQAIQEVVDEFVAKRKAAGHPKLRWRVSRGVSPLPRMGAVHQSGHRARRLRRSPARAASSGCGSTAILKAGSSPGNFSQDARGRWYCNIVCEIEIKTLGGNAEIGIDLGHEVGGQVLATGRSWSAPRSTAIWNRNWPKLSGGPRSDRSRRSTPRSQQAEGHLHKFSRLVNRSRTITVGNVSASKLARPRWRRAFSMPGGRCCGTTSDTSAITQG